MTQGMFAVSDLRRTAQRVFYYARNFCADALPQIVFRRRLDDLLNGLSARRESVIQDRLAYYNKLDGNFEPTAHAVATGRIPRRHSFYYYDLKEHSRYFDQRLRIDYLFGDVVHTPPAPTIVKSRPIKGDNRNSVLLNLDKFRHFRREPDPVPFDKKRPLAVWRGAANHPRRTPFVEKCSGLASCDIGFSNGGQLEYRRPRMSLADQMGFRYIISIEGNDVATNLKWIMASQSVCIMPPPSCETWFMEGRLEPDVHYVCIKPDFSDLEAKIDYFEHSLQEARQIVASANAYVDSFFQVQDEQLISLLVLYKYFVLSGQLDPVPDVGCRFPLILP